MERAHGDAHLVVRLDGLAQLHLIAVDRDLETVFFEQARVEIGIFSELLARVLKIVHEVAVPHDRVGVELAETRGPIVDHEIFRRLAAEREHLERIRSEFYCFECHNLTLLFALTTRSGFMPEGSYRR